MLKNLFLSFFLLSCTYAEVYTPYVFTEQDLSEREDLKEYSYHFELAADNHIPIESLSSTNSQVYFFKEVASFLKAFESGRDESVRAEFLWPNCNKLKLSGYPEINKNLEGLCKPELVLNQVRIDREYNLEDLQSLSGTIHLLLAPLRAIPNLPRFIQEPQFVSKGRTILSKINFSRTLDFYRKAFNSLNELKGKTNEASLKRKIIKLQQEVQGLHQAISGSYLSSLEENEKSCQKYLHAYLNRSERKFLAKYLGALSWRIRGGGLWEKFDGTQSLRRNFGGKVFANLILMLGGGEDLGHDFAKNMEARLRLKGWSDWFDMGTEPVGGDVFYDLMQMTRRGMYQVGVGSYYGPVGGLFSHTSAVQTFKRHGRSSRALEMAGSQMGICYFYSKENLHDLRVGEELNYPLSDFIHNFKSFGEVCFGAVLGSSLAYDIDTAQCKKP